MRPLPACLKLLRLSIAGLCLLMAFTAPPPAAAANTAAAPTAATGPTAPGIYRCSAGEAGHTPSGSAATAPLYTDQPCPNGRPVDAHDPRSAEQRRAALARTREEEQWAQKARVERERRERVAEAARQRQAPVIDRPALQISPAHDRQRERELRRMSRQRSAPPAKAPAAPAQP